MLHFLAMILALFVTPLCLISSLLVLFSKPENIDSLVFTWPGSKHQETWMFHLASFTDRIEELQTRKVSPLARDVLAVERKGENHVYHDTVRKRWPWSTLTGLEERRRPGMFSSTPENVSDRRLGVPCARSRLHRVGALLWLFGAFCPGSLSKEPNNAAVPGKAEPGLLRFVF